MVSAWEASVFRLTHSPDEGFIFRKLLGCFTFQQSYLFWWQLFALFILYLFWLFDRCLQWLANAWRLLSSSISVVLAPSGMLKTSFALFASSYVTVSHLPFLCSSAYLASHLFASCHIVFSSVVKDHMNACMPTLFQFFKGNSSVWFNTMLWFIDDYPNKSN